MSPEYALKEAGYKIAFSGKNHSHPGPERFGYLHSSHHWGSADGIASEAESAADASVRSDDPLPYPCRHYVFKLDEHNWYASHRYPVQVFHMVKCFL